MEVEFVGELAGLLWLDCKRIAGGEVRGRVGDISLCSE